MYICTYVHRIEYFFLFYLDIYKHACGYVHTQMSTHVGIYTKKNSYVHMHMYKCMYLIPMYKKIMYIKVYLKVHTSTQMWFYVCNSKKKPTTVY